MSFARSAAETLGSATLPKSSTRVEPPFELSREDKCDTYPPRDHRFWLVFLALDLATLLTALEIVSARRDVDAPLLTHSPSPWSDQRWQL